METIPCKFCGQPTTMRGTKMCDACWNVEQGLDRFIRSSAGREYVRTALGDTIPATERHDAGAIARCSGCGRYSIHPNSLSGKHPCACGKVGWWSGSFATPGPDARWDGYPPAKTEPLIPSSILVKLHGEMMERAERAWRMESEEERRVGETGRRACVAEARTYEACARIVTEAHDAAVKGGG